MIDDALDAALANERKERVILREEMHAALHSHKINDHGEAAAFAGGGQSQAIPSSAILAAGVDAGGLQAQLDSLRRDVEERVSGLQALKRDVQGLLEREHAEADRQEMYTLKHR